MFGSKEAQKLQDKIYREMPAEKKVKIAGQMFLFGQKLHQLRKQNVSKPAFNKNCKDFRRS